MNIDRMGEQYMEWCRRRGLASNMKDMDLSECLFRCLNEIEDELDVVLAVEVEDAPEPESEEVLEPVEPARVHYRMGAEVLSGLLEHYGLDVPETASGMADALNEYFDENGISELPEVAE